jgi:hypothetical protein
MSAVAIEADPFYYLTNSHTALDWISERSADLLNAEDVAFIERFQRLSQPARGLLVRLLMRQGALFRSSKIAYPEMGAESDAAAELIEQALLNDQPLLAIEELFGLLCKDE